jgi:hypothetical protein
MKSVLQGRGRVSLYEQGFLETREVCLAHLETPGGKQAKATLSHRGTFYAFFFGLVNINARWVSVLLLSKFIRA